MENGLLSIRGKRDEGDSEGQRYLHKGIANRGFERKFQLADHIEVVGAKLEHGLLQIDLVREVPEAMKPKRIHINQTGKSQLNVA